MPEHLINGLSVSDEAMATCESMLRGDLQKEVEASEQPKEQNAKELYPEVPKKSSDKTEEKPKEKYSKAEKVRLYKALRALDPPNKRTCKSCLRRVTLDKIKGGYVDFCEDCE